MCDDDLSTDPSIASDNKHRSFWNTIDLEYSILCISLDSDSTTCLCKDWLTPYEIEEKNRSNIRQAQLRKLLQPDLKESLDTPRP